MANVKATTMSDGTNTAYFLNALKIDDDMLILYNEENELMNATLELNLLRAQLGNEEETSASGDGRQKVYYANNHITEITANSNCTSALNNLILSVYNNGGGVIKLDGIVYVVSAIYLLPGVYIEGAGMGNTIIKRLEGTQLGGDFIDRESIGHGFVNVKKDSCNVGLRNLTLHGNCINNPDTENMVNYIDFTPGEATIHGLAFQDCENAYSSSGGAINVIDNLELCNDPGSIITTGAEERVRKYALIENVAIIGFSGHGVYIGGNNKEITLNNVQIIDNFKTGIKNHGTDCVFNQVRVKNVYDDGIDNQGNNNRFNNIHLSSNGLNKHSGYALHCYANNNTFVNIHLIDNWCNGIYIHGNNNIFNALLIDSNGYRSKLSSEEWSMIPQDTTLIYMNSCQKCIIQASISNYRNDYAPRIPLEATNSRYNIIDITQESNVAQEKSNISGTEITDNITNETIFDNIVRYLQS
jgi:hypothetical protein